ncbi:hypothetical protein [Pseudobacteriovorax antillogorgiicola]|uniref:Porin n=1 Tax=Pseudobacteriovorax antillogorgiicola TaxID=1513793 RepID=A0A1Y6BV47_9BACT|nr:hypothetical protein [Pseudobacteriovorax antillogorgiicola]TCS53736.1 hypothetical protein EDD56_10745 [Pseudobacteriovorax antillogorgiicola]SMF22698.1 hypothetical protein SAMN06296036_107227 [Pseudobacteriovorax antillogorgiicola]
MKLPLLIFGIAASAHAVGETNISFNYNLYLESNDEGFEKQEGLADPGRTHSIGLNPYLEFAGTQEDLSWTVYFNVDSEAVSDGIEVAKATKKFGSLTVHAGKDYTHSGGWDNENADYDVNLVNQFTSDYVFGGGAAKLVQLDYQLGQHTLSLQLTDDVVKTSLDGDGSCPEVTRNCLRYSGDKGQPAFLFEYVGILPPHFQPLLQIASYDNGHSLETTVGVQFNFFTVTGYLDYVLNKVGYQLGDEDLVDTMSAITFDLRYQAPKYVLRLKYVDFDVEQDTNISANSDRESFDDNHTGVQLGFDWTAYGAEFTPYLELIQISQDVLDNGGEEETLNEMSLIAGVKGSI